MLSKGKKVLALAMCAAMMATAVSFTGCAKKSTGSTTSGSDARPTAESVKKEGKLVTYGMPGSWANYEELYTNFTKQYGVTHQDTDMSSAEEIAKFKAEKNSPVADLGDIGIAFTSGAKKQGVLLAYKNKYFNEVPSWAKDANGYWCCAYTGTICFIVNKKLVKDVPTSWKDLLKSEYKNCVVTGDVQKAAEAQTGLLAAAIANGGSESNIQPGIDYFKKLKQAGNIKDVDKSVATIQKGEVPISFSYDFNALNNKYTSSNPDDFEVVIPSDGSVMSAYASIINAYAPHPNTAKAFQDYVFSDEGQALLAKGYARPIRTNVKIPDSTKSKMIPDSEYKNVTQVKDQATWDATAKTIPNLWRDNVMS
jgi:putative spermidine/putrescine transport system substrate-binding protein